MVQKKTLHGALQRLRAETAMVDITRSREE